MHQRKKHLEQQQTKYFGTITPIILLNKKANYEKNNKIFLSIRFNCSVFL